MKRAKSSVISSAASLSRSVRSASSKTLNSDSLSHTAKQERDPVADKPAKSNSQPKIPSNWDREGLSQGKQTGPVRKAPDAYNERGKKK